MLTDISNKLLQFFIEISSVFRFGGTLHPFMKCTKLRHLVVCHNRISGSLGTDLTQLPDLQLLYASYNRLSGPVPASICLLGKLSKLNLSNNELSGTLPAAFGNLENLEICILGNSASISDILLCKRIIS